MKVINKIQAFRQYEVTDHGIIDEFENMTTSQLTIEHDRISYVLVGKINKGNAKLSFRRMKISDLEKMKELIDGIIEFAKENNNEPGTK